LASQEWPLEWLIARINSIIGKEIHRTVMLVDITQLHENHIYKLVTMVKNSAEILNEFVKYSAAAASSYLDSIISSLQHVLTTVEKGLEQAQNQKLSFSLFPHDVLLSIKCKIDHTAADNGFISYVSKVTDLFQIPLSYVYQPNNKTIALLLHVPLVKQEYLLNLNQYLTFHSHTACLLTIL